MLTFSAVIAAFKRPRIPLPAFLGLLNPSEPELQDSFFFPSPLASQRLGLLKNMISRPGHVVVVIGERGSGKTTLLQQLLADSGELWRPVQLRFKSLRQGSGEKISPCPAFWIERDADSPSVVVDDAHRLCRLELKALLESASGAGGSKIANLVLFAEPRIRGQLHEMVLWMPPRAAIDKIYMTPFTEKQTDEYLRHRFKMAGILPRHPFSPTQIRSIFQISSGLPGWINGEAFMLLKRLYAGKGAFRKSLFSRWPRRIDWRWLTAVRRFVETKLMPDRPGSDSCY